MTVAQLKRELAKLPFACENMEIICSGKRPFEVKLERFVSSCGRYDLAKYNTTTENEPFTAIELW